MGSFRRVAHLPPLAKIWSSSHFNYGLGKADQEFYSWGFANGYVLANGNENDSLR